MKNGYWKKWSRTIILIVLALSLVACGNNTVDSNNFGSEQISNQKNLLSIEEYIEKYNLNLREFVSVSQQTTVSDSRYIGCAKTIIDDRLKSPSTATYNSSYVEEKDGYGRAIVYLDVSAQNSFGGWVREEYYVCIQNVNSDGKFTYYKTMPYIDSGSFPLYDTFKTMNHFGEDPVDIKIEKSIISLDTTVYENVVMLSPSQNLECYRAVTESGTQYIYIDENTKKVISIRFIINQAANEEEFEMELLSSVAALTDKNIDIVKENINQVFNVEEMIPLESSKYYMDGYIYDCAYDYLGVGIAITLSEKKSYDSDLYWTPHNKDNYYEAIGDKFLSEKDYDNAIIYYEMLINSGEKLLSAYYNKAEECLENGDFDMAGYCFACAGDYKDSAVRVLEVYYSAGEKHEKDKDYISASYSYFMAGDYLDANLKYKECNYKLGEEYIAGKQYFDAITCFGEADDYSDAKEKYNESCYLYAEEQLQLGELESAAYFFEEAKNYMDAETRMEAYYYDLGMEALNNEEYLIASDYFMKVIGYSDSEDKFKESNYLYGKKQLELNYISDAIEYLSKCRGYKDTDELILGHYYSEALLDVALLFQAFSGEDVEEIPYNIYKDAQNKLVLCEGYKDSASLLKIIDKLYYVWEEMQYESDFEASLNGMEVSYTGNNIVIQKTNFMSGSSCKLKLTHNVDNNTFDATITNMFNSSAREYDVRRVISAMLILFTDVENTEDFDSRFAQKNNWFISGENERFNIVYGGYTIEVQTQPGTYGYIDCSISVK